MTNTLDIYGIDATANASELTRSKNANKIFEAEDGRSSYEIIPFKQATPPFFDEAHIRAINDNIHIVFLVKKFNTPDKIAKITNSVEEILNDIQTKWGEVTGKEDILNASKQKLVGLDGRNYETKLADINSPTTELIEKIHIEFTIDIDNLPLLSVSFINKI